MTLDGDRTKPIHRPPTYSPPFKLPSMPSLKTRRTAWGGNERLTSAVASATSALARLILNFAPCGPQRPLDASVGTGRSSSEPN